MGRRIMSMALALAAVLCLLPVWAVSAAPQSLEIDLGPVTVSGGAYAYPYAQVDGENIRTLLISFSDSITPGDTILLPTDTPSGFHVSATSAVNSYVKRINLDAGVTSAQIEDYLRMVGFTVGGENQRVEFVITTDTIEYDTFYNIDTQHYYQYIPDRSSNWIAAYRAARDMRYMGRTGYLATVTSRGEDVFVNSLSGGMTGWLGGTILSNLGEDSSFLYYTGFDFERVVSTGWYWACGPEKGTTFYNQNSLRPPETPGYAAGVDAANAGHYSNWGRGDLYCEPNNETDRLSFDQPNYETCLTTLLISDISTGKEGTDFSWNDKHYTSVGSGQWDAKGYFVEYGNATPGDTGSAGDAYASAGGRLTSFYHIDLTSRLDGTPADVADRVELVLGE